MTSRPRSLTLWVSRSPRSPTRLISLSTPISRHGAWSTLRTVGVGPTFQIWAYQTRPRCRSPRPCHSRISTAPSRSGCGSPRTLTRLTGQRYPRRPRRRASFLSVPAPWLVPGTVPTATHSSSRDQTSTRSQCPVTQATYKLMASTGCSGSRRFRWRGPPRRRPTLSPPGLVALTGPTTRSSRRT